MGFWEMKAALDWQIACGADEAILDVPIDRTQIPEKPKVAAKSPKPTGPVPMADVDVVGIAQAAAAAAVDLDALKSAMEAYPHCDLKRRAAIGVFRRATECTRHDRRRGSGARRGHARQAFRWARWATFGPDVQPHQHLAQ